MPAAPSPQVPDESRLRDTFAAAVATGLAGRPSFGTATDLARKAYEIADALLAARDRRVTNKRNELAGIAHDPQKERVINSA